MKYSKALNPEDAKVLADWTGFFRLLEEHDRRIEDNLKLFRVNISRFEGLQPIFVWLVDWNPEHPTLGGRAMFSVVGASGGETAFYTRDPSLMSALHGIVKSFGGGRK